MNFSYFYVDLKTFFMIEVEVLFFTVNNSSVRFYWCQLYTVLGNNFIGANCIQY